MIKGKNQEKKVYVVGHKNPDTDSICAAITYANLKRELTGEQYVARRAGKVNEETQYVLDRFGVEAPPLLATVKLQVKDMDIHRTQGISPDASIKDTWSLMKENHIKTLPVLSDDELLGVISTGDIAKSYMDVYDNEVLATAKTSYRNLCKTLDGQMLLGNEHARITKGKVTVGASTKDIMQEFIDKDDLVIVGNRFETQSCALDIDASCLVLCQNGEMSEELLERASEQEVTVISTPYDTYTVARLINQSIPVKYFMTSDDIVTVRLDNYVDDIKEKITNQKYRDFPVLNRKGQFEGFISRRRFLAVTKKQVILVDHNEKDQAVNGLDEAEVVEIIDHHRLGRMETSSPVFFRNQPVGSTSTIIANMYKEQGVRPNEVMAGLMCCAIMSDTLLFRSPTSTPLDETTAKDLAIIAGINMEETAGEMFHAGSNLEGKTAEEIFQQDFKQFTINNVVFGIGQINVLSNEELENVKELVEPYLPEAVVKNQLHMVYFMITNIFAEASELLCYGGQSREVAIDAFDLAEDTQVLWLEKVISRKKQLVPALLGSLQQ
jgi:manganese-dependent inorganic pyrophosphatase